MTTIHNVTADQCLALAERASSACDEKMYRIATAAARLLDRGATGCRDESAVRACVLAIRADEVQS